MYPSGFEGGWGWVTCYGGGVVLGSGGRVMRSMLGCWLHWVEVYGWVVLWFLLFGVERCGWVACCGIAGGVRVPCRVVWGAGVRLVWGWLRKAGDGCVEWDGVRVGWVGGCLARGGGVEEVKAFLDPRRSAGVSGGGGELLFPIPCAESLVWHLRDDLRTAALYKCAWCRIRALLSMRLLFAWHSSLSTWDCGSGQRYVQSGLQPLVSGLFPCSALH